MAKGDAANASAQPQAPKMDQYSVMHRIMDNLGGQNQGMAPSMNFNPSALSNMMGPAGMGGRFGTQPVTDNTPLNNPSNPPPIIGKPFGQYSNDFMQSARVANGGQPIGIVPNDPQEMIRRTMTGNNGLRMG